MAITRKDAHGNDIYITDPSGNEIEGTGKTIAGSLLILVTLFTIVLIIAHWPDKMPAQGPQVSTKYQYKWFAINYLGPDGRDNRDTTTFLIPRNAVVPKPVTTDTAITVITIADQDTSKTIIDSIKLKVVTKNDCKKSSKCTIDLNTLILLLVAFAGFLGNMVHIGSSFTNFIGAGKFRRSWMLWYIVKPFTASALSVGVYIVFRAGFLNSAEATASVNLYGVVAIGLLAGLYTDMATQKLKEVFGVIFQSSTVRPNPLEVAPIKITSTTPKIIPLNEETTVVLSGSGFDNRTLKLTINGKDIAGVSVQPNALVFTYTATEEELLLHIYDEKAVEIAKYELTAAAQVPPAPVTTITDITPVALALNAATEITLTGTSLDTATLVIKVADAVIPDANIIKTATTIKFTYTATVAGNIAIVVTNDSADELFNRSIPAA